MKAAGTLVLLIACLSGAVQAQDQDQRPTTPAPARPPSSRCLFRVDSVGRQGTQTVSGADTNYFAGGNVYLRCSGSSTKMRSDSIASYGAKKIVQFIGRVRYDDSAATLDSDFSTYHRTDGRWEARGHVVYRDSVTTTSTDVGTYYRADERWEARGHVVTQNLETGSKLVGPMLDYYRKMRGVRDTFEMYAKQRPRIEYVTMDSTGKRTEPYVIVAERVRFKGKDRVWAGGMVTIDRSDFAARGDSLDLDTGKGSAGTLLGGDPVLKGTRADSFDLHGRRIDFLLDQRAITYLTAKGAARVVSKEWDLVGDTIALDVNHDVVEQTLAWGDSTRPSATSTRYAMKADSLAFDTPGQKLREIRGFGRAWLGSDTDSASGERNWMRGDTVLAAFVQRDSAGTEHTMLSRIDARKGAQSYHFDTNTRFPEKPSINYSRGNEIVVIMRDGEQRGVDRVDVRGQVDGIHLEAGVAPADSAAAKPPSRGGP